MIKILITGVNSYLGNAVEKWLLQEPDKYQITKISVRDESWKKVDFSQFDVVYHVASIAHVNAKKNDESLYYKVNRDLTLKVALKAKESQVSQFIFMSSIIVYGETKSLKPIIIDKDTIPQPNGFYGKSKLEAEEGLQKLSSEDFKIAIIRPPMIYGANCKGNFPRLVKLSKSIPLFPCFHNQRSMLFVDNLCIFVKKIIDIEANGIFHPQNDEYSDTVELMRTLSQIQGHKIIFSKLLIPFVYCASLCIHSINKVFGTEIYEKDIDVLVSDCSFISLTDSLEKTKI